MSKGKIKKLFAALPVEEQYALLKELASTSDNISDFSIIHQKRYGTNIKFTIEKSGVDHDSTITATIHTAYGDYQAQAPNKKIAKALAIEKARIEIDI